MTLLTLIVRFLLIIYWIFEDNQKYNLCIKNCEELILFFLILYIISSKMKISNSSQTLLENFDKKIRVHIIIINLVKITIHRRPKK